MLNEPETICKALASAKEGADVLLKGVLHLPSDSQLGDEISRHEFPRLVDESCVDWEEGNRTLADIISIVLTNVKNNLEWAETMIGCGQK